MYLNYTKNIDDILTFVFVIFMVCFVFTYFSSRGFSLRFAFFTLTLRRGTYFFACSTISSVGVSQNILSVMPVNKNDAHTTVMSKPSKRFDEEKCVDVAMVW